MAVECIVSFGGFADRGLGSLPGGDESELVKGVRACREAVRPGYDMVAGWENSDEVALEAEVSDQELASRSVRCGPWRSGEYASFPCAVTSSRVADGARPAAVALEDSTRSGWSELVGSAEACVGSRWLESVGCKSAVGVEGMEGVGAEARGITWRKRSAGVGALHGRAGAMQVVVAVQVSRPGEDRLLLFAAVTMRRTRSERDGAWRAGRQFGSAAVRAGGLCRRPKG